MTGTDGFEPARDEIALAMIELAAEHGFEGLRVEAICARAQVSKTHFERRYTDLQECFLRVHDEIAAELWERLWPAYLGARGWHDRIWAAGFAMMGFLLEDPVRARFLLVAVNGIGREALERRDRIVRRFADLLDEDAPHDVRQGTRRSRATAEMAAGALFRTLVGKIEAGAIERGEDFLPELIYMTVMPYLGAEAAEDQLAVQPLH